ncbi:hypothetical protein PHLGIDRAFT_101482 [Phlebiopsis gigantea 11061_1 CR5-6]|uniref:Cytochrome P450 n=1 Tax=Phlebiopsis gigantea (strain 11061_1 CR5-6) TaxID=745531 RepID=A0A0C3S3Y9_PHLG1|nr:hypothetical protein PHLGIDRAFT_101482 [Phlebiopsis gigantea 11061_1 CR5-6]
MSSHAVLYLAALATLALGLLWRGRLKKSRLPYPPGPPAEFLLGHARIFPRAEPHVQITQWARQYGDVMYFNILGKSLVVLNSQTATTDLLEKRGAIYSSRPHLQIFELAGWGSLPVFLPYGKEWARYHKFFAHTLGPKRVSEYQPVQLRHAHRLVRNMLDAPSEFSRHVNRYSVGVVLEAAYGPDMAADAKLERTIKYTEEITEKLAEMGDTSFLDLMPFLVHFPSWLPGLRCLAVAKETSKLQQKNEHEPFDDLRSRVSEGQAQPSLITGPLEELNKEGRSFDKQCGSNDEEELKFLRICGAIMVGAGGETTWTSIMNFIAAMLLFPNAQVKAQEEIDRVVGRDRLPEFSDRSSLTFVQCVMWESWRYHPPAPLGGTPHYSTEDDEYNGMFIPKGSTILMNTTALVTDERVYKNPHLFMPERYLPEHGEPLPMNATFGNGRRICAGRHLAEASVWIAIASLLALFEIRPVLDGDGKEVTPDIKFTSAITSHPEPFQCRFVPRNPKLGSLVEKC